MRIPSSAKTTAAAGCMKASIVQIARARSMTAGSSVNSGGSTPASASRIAPNRQPATRPQAIERQPTARAVAASPAPRARPTSTCAAIAIASSVRARKTNRPIAIWCAASDGSPIRAITALAVANATSRAAERTKSSPEMRTSGASSARRATARRGRRAQQQPRERRAHAELRDDGPGRRAVEAPVQAVDEPQLEHEVDDLRGDDDEQRRAQVVDPAQVALAGQRDERRDEAERADAQVAGGELGGLALAAEQRDERVGQHEAGERERDPDRGGQPQRLRGQLAGAGGVARAVQARDLGRRPVREKEAQRDERREHRGGDRERRELDRPEVPDDRRVDEQVQRLGRERAERGDRKTADLAIVGRSQHAADSTIRPWVRSATRRSSARARSPCSLAAPLAGCTKEPDPVPTACFAEPGAARRGAAPGARGGRAAGRHAPVALRQHRAHRRRPAVARHLARARRRPPARAGGHGPRRCACSSATSAARCGPARAAPPSGIADQLARRVGQLAMLEPGASAAATAALARGERAGERSG